MMSERANEQRVFFTVQFILRVQYLPLFKNKYIKDYNTRVRNHTHHPNTPIFLPNKINSARFTQEEEGVSDFVLNFLQVASSS